MGFIGGKLKILVSGVDPAGSSIPSLGTTYFLFERKKVSKEKPDERFTARGYGYGRSPFFVGVYSNVV